MGGGGGGGGEPGAFLTNPNRNGPTHCLGNHQQLFRKPGLVGGANEGYHDSYFKRLLYLFTRFFP